MKVSYVEMGKYYRSVSYGLIRTVCRGYHFENDEPMIAFVNVGEGGFASDVQFMPEIDFVNTFIN